MIIQTARLSQEEQRLLSLTGSTDLLFDYVADQSLQSIQLQCYQLDAQNQWQPISGGGQFNVSSANGRLALQASPLADGLRVGVQSANGAVSASRKTAPQSTTLPEGMQWETVKAEQQTIAYQISDFYYPERFTQQGLHQVYALTIRFSRNQLGDNPLPDETDEEIAEETGFGEETAS